jgi:dienelactone hydrolase
LLKWVGLAIAAIALPTNGAHADPSLDNLIAFGQVWVEERATGDPRWVPLGDLTRDGVLDWRDCARALDLYLSGAVGVLEKVDPAPGFEWPYYLYTPASLLPAKSTRLLVLPNNTGTGSDDQAVHDAAAKRLAEIWANRAELLSTPVLVPTFPRPYTHWEVYTHALDRDTLLTDMPGLGRLDLQLIAMADHARSRLQSRGYQVDDRVLMAGFSASGMFTNRFTALHPERVQAASVGSPGSWPLAPVASWNGETLRYPVGVADVQTLVGAPFDLATLRSVPLRFYIGDQDTNDSVPIADGYDPQDTELVNRLFGTTPLARWPHAEEIYKAAQCTAEFVTYPGIGHTQTMQTAMDELLFLGHYL